MGFHRDTVGSTDPLRFSEQTPFCSPSREPPSAQGVGGTGLRARTVHAPLTRNVLGAPDETWRREVVEVLASYLRLAAGLESTEVIIHPVPNPIFVPEGDHPDPERPC